MSSSKRSQQKSKALPIGIGLAVVAVALVVAFTTADDPTTTTRPAGEVSVSGIPLPELVNPAADSAMGLAAPVVTGTDLSGRPVTIGPGQNPKIVVFLAHWCSFCQAEVPRIQAYVEEGGTAGVDIIAVATSNSPDRPNYPAQAWLERENWSNPVLLDDDTGKVAQAYGLSAFPFMVVIDIDGNVVLRVSGELERTALETLFEVARTS